MSDSVLTVLMFLSAVVQMEVCECSICGAWSTVLLFMNLLPRMTKVCFPTSLDSAILIILQMLVLGGE